MTVSQKKAILLRELSIFHDQIPDLKEWSENELDALQIMLNRIWIGTIKKAGDDSKSIPMLLKNFKCSASELRSAIATQLTCADWSSGTDQVQHFATFMLSGSAPMSQYTERAIELLTSYIEFVKLNPEHYESDEIQKLESAISFLARFK